MKFRLTLVDAAWLLAFVALLSAVTGFMLQARQHALRDLSTPAAQAEWQRWRDEAAKQSTGKGTVQRRVPSSNEPPTLVLLRDHFAVCLTGSLIFSAALFGSLMLMARGALSAKSRAFEVTDDDRPHDRKLAEHE